MAIQNNVGRSSAYRRILRIGTLWLVASVDLQLTPKKYISISAMKNWPVPSAPQPANCYDNEPERQWLHLDTCQYRTILHADPWRSQCPRTAYGW